MTFGSLFAGAGGMDLGLERAGMKCVFQVEIDDYATRVLEKHWPTVRRWRDVRDFSPEPVDDWRCDLLCGGFPCQPVSNAGLRRFKEDERWLWPEFSRIIRLLRPQFVLLENVPGLLSKGFGIVLADLSEIGFDAEWSIVSACSLGAAHPRSRLFVVAYPSGSMGKEGLRIRELEETRTIQRINDLSAPVLRLESAHRNGGNFDGIYKRLDRRYVVAGNAVVPNVAKWIGERILLCQRNVTP